MEKQKKVLDASVLVKWFSSEEDTNKALIFREKQINEEIEIIIPELAIIEVINSLRYKKKSEQDLQKAVDSLLQMQLSIANLTEDLLRKSIKISLDSDLTFYDSMYVAIAQLNGCSLVTADKELCKLPNSIPLSQT